MTLALDDLDAEAQRLRTDGFEFEERSNDAAPRRLVVRDVDGNMITFFEDPQPRM